MSSLAKRLAIEFNFTCYLPYKLIAQKSRNLLDNKNKKSPPQQAQRQAF